VQPLNNVSAALIIGFLKMVNACNANFGFQTAVNVIIIKHVRCVKKLSIEIQRICALLA
jgi:hypothetical protein